ncbi:grasp-with-spasm system SPASM domain peptide maturase [Kordia sp. YSTF-M3]|uniref:Grasp-with-spasm system SPASM domain peptide maturase n=1 Tax=Kordia aestuariivivens TaxID=2759037 RepID=A0ABR7QD53_9FLAO|nr:grasp-with-spasm system SPASM domain peptide maturase [Kordia aestuariivivens]MBC8756453.1 grasp-with-spasm system SPASM domain peptide maturase [Kordia aestuariivivens]
MIDKDNYFKFHNSCVPVKGSKRGVIFDLQRGSFFFFPNSIIDLLLENETNTLATIYKEYESQTALLDKYFNYLVANELIHLTKDVSRFPSNSNKFSSPFLLDILFLEIDTLQESKIALLQNINSLGCIQVVFLTRKEVDSTHLENVLNLLEGSKIQSVSLITKHEAESEAEILNLHYTFPRFKKTVFFESNEQEQGEDKPFSYENGSFDTVLTKRITNIHDFILNQKAYRESLKHNLFFNRKAYIDNEGNIKNYYNSEITHGSIEKDDIKSIVTSKAFKKLWKIPKEKIEVCKSCEFRYVCPDNRIPVLKSNLENEVYEHNSTCNYDPQTTEWKS